MQEDGFAEADRVPVIRLERKAQRTLRCALMQWVAWCNASSTSLGVCHAPTVRENSSNSPCTSGEPWPRAEPLPSSAKFMCEETSCPPTTNRRGGWAECPRPNIRRNPQTRAGGGQVVGCGTARLAWWPERQPMRTVAWTAVPLRPERMSRLPPNCCMREIIPGMPIPERNGFPFCPELASVFCPSSLITKHSLLPTHLKLTETRVAEA